MAVAAGRLAGDRSSGARPGARRGAGGRPRRRPSGRPGWPWPVSVAAWSLMWLPPLVQQFTNHPGNLTLIWPVLRHRPPGPVAVRLAVVGGRRRAAVLVVGPGRGDALDPRRDPGPRRPGRGRGGGDRRGGGRHRRPGAPGSGPGSPSGSAPSAWSGAVAVGGGRHPRGRVRLRLPGGVGRRPARWPPWSGSARCRRAACRRRSRAPWSAGGAVRRRRGRRCGAAVRVAGHPAVDRGVATRTSAGWPRWSPHGSCPVAGWWSVTPVRAPADTQLLDTEEFIGLVNLLDQRRLPARPSTPSGRPQFGPGYLSDGPRTAGSPWPPGPRRRRPCPATWAGWATWRSPSPTGPAPPPAGRPAEAGSARRRLAVVAGRRAPVPPGWPCPRLGGPR